jgi:hypothetical protein
VVVIATNDTRQLRAHYLAAAAGRGLGWSPLSPRTRPPQRAADRAVHRHVVNTPRAGRGTSATRRRGQQHSTLQNPSHVLQHSGQYTVSLTATTARLIPRSRRTTSPSPPAVAAVSGHAHPDADAQIKVGSTTVQSTRPTCDPRGGARQLARFVRFNIRRSTGRSRTSSSAST